MAGDQKETNGKEPIRWKDIERMALIATILGSGIFYFANITMKLDRMDVKITSALEKIQADAGDNEQERQKLVRLHASLGMPLPCARCMGAGKVQ